MSRAFGLSPGEVGWLVAVFTLPGVALTPVAGLLADRYDRKRVLVPSLLLFAAAGHACAYAGDFGQLLILRALQGVGAASLGALNATLIADLYSGDMRATAMGYNAGVISAGATAFPLAGGALAILGWRYPFVLPLLAVPIALAVGFGLRSPDVPWGGSFASYFSKLAEGLMRGGALAMLGAGCISFILLYGAMVTFLPFLLEAAFGATSMQIGLVFAAGAVASTVGTVSLGAMVRRVSRKTIVLAAFAAMTTSMAVIPLVPSLVLAAAAAALFGAGHGVGVATVQVLMSETAAAERRAAVMALNSMMFRLGQTVGPLLMAALLAAGGMDAVYLGAAALGALAIAMLAIAMPGGRRTASG